MGEINPSETQIVLPGDLEWSVPEWAEPGVCEEASVFGDLTKPGEYLTVLKWYPGCFSAPHTYLTDRVCTVVSGEWLVNSGPDFDWEQCVPVTAGGFVRRIATTPHYDGARPGAKEPAVIAISGEAPVGMGFVDPSGPKYYRVS